MKIVIEFYRIRQQDGAHAVVGRETEESGRSRRCDFEVAWRWRKPLDMPQRPDALTIADASGRALCTFAAAPKQGEMPAP